MKRKDASDDVPANVDWSKAVSDDFEKRFKLKGVLVDRDLLKQFESPEELELALREYLARRALHKRSA